ncbi:MAG: DUF2752 domain-containing protein [Firmicutes bacterium]|nr:DUF2752 domain-containing protein [Bacillota bacterium]
MKEKYKLVILAILYFIFGKLTGLYLSCPIHEILGLYCPGCGITRMILSILKFDFYKAFRYNILIFILSPFFVFLFLESIYSDIKNKESMYKKINNKVWYFLIIILIVYGILRNIYPVLGPM